MNKRLPSYWGNAALLSLSLLPMLGHADSIADEALASDKTAFKEATVGKITLNRMNVFDLSIPAENNWLYRLANRLHIMTHESVIESQLLFRPGDTVTPRLIEETARILRQRQYFYDAAVEPTRLNNGVVDLTVTTRDVWTLTPEISVSRSGGKNKTSLGFEEANLFGTGQRVTIEKTSDVDRDSTVAEFSDENFANSWWATQLRYANTSDGHSADLSVIRPFYALETRWSTGISLGDDDLRGTRYSLGEEAAEYQQEHRFADIFVGRSSGLQNGWVSRYTTGFVYDDNQFSTVDNPVVPPLIPADRKLAYPYVGIDVFQDQFQTTSNHDQIDKTEDFYTGMRMAARVGLSSGTFGADHTAVVYSASASRGYGALSDTALLLAGSLSGRYEHQAITNSLLDFDARFYRQQSSHRVFYASASGTFGHSLDMDNPVSLGGDSGLRGYPLRYQSGDSKMLMSIEQRYFTDWYPFRLFRVGGAIFFDAGRVWGDNPVAEERFGWLKDAGFGLRFALTRSGTHRVVHLDVAFPMDGDSSVESVQILLVSRNSF